MGSACWARAGLGVLGYLTWLKLFRGRGHRRPAAARAGDALAFVTGLMLVMRRACWPRCSCASTTRARASRPTSSRRCRRRRSRSASGSLRAVDDADAPRPLPDRVLPSGPRRRRGAHPRPRPRPRPHGLRGHGRDPPGRERLAGGGDAGRHARRPRRAARPRAHGQVPHGPAGAWPPCIVSARTYDVLVVRGTRVLGLPGLVAARAAGKRVILQPEVNGEMSGEVYTWGRPFAGTPLDRAIRAGTRARNLLLRDADALRGHVAPHPRRDAGGRGAPKRRWPSSRTAWTRRGFTRPPRTSAPTRAPASACPPDAVRHRVHGPPAAREGAGGPPGRVRAGGGRGCRRPISSSSDPGRARRSRWRTSCAAPPPSPASPLV